MPLSDSDSDSSDDGPSLAERRARWETPPSESTLSAAGGRPAKKRRKQETRGRFARYEYKYEKGDERRRRLDAATSPWWELVYHPEVKDPHSRAAARFRRKFRLPIVEVEKLVTKAQRVREWKDKPAGAGHGKGPSRNPLVLKVLAALRHLAMGDTPESLEDAARISASSLKAFIPKFVEWLATDIYAGCSRRCCRSLAAACYAHGVRRVGASVNRELTVGIHFCITFLYHSREVSFYSEPKMKLVFQTGGGGQAGSVRHSLFMICSITLHKLTDLPLSHYATSVVAQWIQCWVNKRVEGLMVNSKR